MEVPVRKVLQSLNLNFEPVGSYYLAKWPHTLKEGPSKSLKESSAYLQGITESKKMCPNL